MSRPRVQASPEKHTPGPEFAKHLLTLQAAIDEVQPLADHRGNLAALLAIVNMKEAMAAVNYDIALLCGDESIRAGKPAKDVLSEVTPVTQV